MRAVITFDDQGGITIEGDEDAVRKAYEIWNPYNAERLTRLSELEPIIQELVEACKACPAGTLYMVSELEGVGAEPDTVEIWIDTGLTVATMGTGYGEPNEKLNRARFFALAANRIAKIGGV